MREAVKPTRSGRQPQVAGNLTNITANASDSEEEEGEERGKEAALSTLLSASGCILELITESRTWLHCDADAVTYMGFRI